VFRNISVPLDLLSVTLAGQSLLVTADDLELIRERIALADHQRRLG